MPRASFRGVHTFHAGSLPRQALLFDEREQSFLITSFYANGGTKFQTMFKIFRRTLVRFHGESWLGIREEQRGETDAPHRFCFRHDWSRPTYAQGSRFR